jgi:hypothetical protein
MRLLHNPTYAGAYAYGQKEYDPYDRSPTNGKAKTKSRPVSDWPVRVRDVYPAYITWDQFVANQQTLRDNWFRSSSRGAPRRGPALLQGIARCGRCGARMSMFHYSTKEKRAPGYGCVAAYANGKTGQMMSSAPVDAAVAELFLAAVTPAQVDVALRALDTYETQQTEVRRQRQMQVQQADYQVELARRRYEATDPANRLVAGELESRWEQVLRDRERLVREAEELDRQEATALGATECRRVREMAVDLGKVQGKRAHLPRESRRTCSRNAWSQPARTFSRRPPPNRT